MNEYRNSDQMCQIYIFNTANEVFFGIIIKGGLKFRNNQNYLHIYG